MEVFIIIFILLLIAVTIGLLVLFYYLRKGIRFFKGMFTGEVDEETFKRMSDKYYSSKNKEDVKFDDDYFKGRGWQGKNGQKQQQNNQQRTTRTADGVTIVDRRDPNEAGKKIFSKDEGEYVEFTEQ